MTSAKEILADIEHQQWEQWATSILKTEKISKNRTARWCQFFMPYSELPEEIKDFDRKWADKVIKALDEAGFVIVTKGVFEFYKTNGGMPPHKDTSND